jgi:hypothetical protein
MVTEGEEDKYVYALKSFAQMAGVVDSLTSSACTSAAVIHTGEQTAKTVDECEINYFTPSCGQLDKTSVTVETVSGSVHVYLSSTTEQPGPHDYELKDESGDAVKTFVFERAAGNTKPLTVAVKGVSDGSSEFTIDTGSDSFDGKALIEIAIDEDVEVPTVCPALGWSCEWPAQADKPCCRNGVAGSSTFYCDGGVDARANDCCAQGAAGSWTCDAASMGLATGFKASDYVVQNSDYTPTFSIIDTSGTASPFQISAETGEVFLSAPLDFEERAQHKVRIAAKDLDQPCLEGFMDLYVNVNNKNDNTPIVLIAGYPLDGGTSIPKIQAHVSEAAAVGTTVFTIGGEDPDGGDVVFELSNSGRRRRQTGSPTYCDKVANICVDFMGFDEPTVGTVLCWNNGECQPQSESGTTGMCDGWASGECEWRRTPDELCARKSGDANCGGATCGVCNNAEDKCFRCSVNDGGKCGGGSTANHYCSTALEQPPFTIDRNTGVVYTTELLSAKTQEASQDFLVSALDKRREAGFA